MASRRAPRRRAPLRLTLGAAHDRPDKIANRAVREAISARDDDDKRHAAETAWLALSSLADVAADKLGRQEPGGFSTRRGALKALEEAANLRRGTLDKPFDLARRELHGECFHGDKCPVDIVYTIEYYRDIVNDGIAAINKIARKKRR